MTIPTFKGHRHALLFTKKECPPCLRTKQYVSRMLNDESDLKEFITLFDKETQTQMVREYNLTLFPSLVVVDSDGIEVDRLVGGNVVTSNIRSVLLSMRANL